MSDATNRPPPPPKPTNLLFATASFSYHTKDPQELSFESGDLLYIIEKSSRDWWRARLAGKDGYVPTNYLDTEHTKYLTPLHDACRRGNKDLLLQCLDNKIPINSLDKAGNTPLHWAAHSGQVECLKTIMSLVDTRVLPINIQNRMGDTPLHMAASRGHLEVISTLRSLDTTAAKGKIDITLKNNDGESAIDLAKNVDVKAELDHWIAARGEKNETSGYWRKDYADSDDDNVG